MLKINLISLRVKFKKNGEWNQFMRSEILKNKKIPSIKWVLYTSNPTIIISLPPPLNWFPIAADLAETSIWCAAGFLGQRLRDSRLAIHVYFKAENS